MGNKTKIGLGIVGVAAVVIAGSSLSNNNRSEVPVTVSSSCVEQMEVPEATTSVTIITTSEPVTCSSEPVEYTTTSSSCATTEPAMTSAASSRTDATSSTTTSYVPTETAPPETTVPETTSASSHYERTVYVAASGNGTKYHSNKNCSRMKGVIEMTISEAQRAGYSPCSRCF